MDDAVGAGGMQASPQVTRALEADLSQFLVPLVEWLDTLLDKRLVRTLVASIMALLEWRNRAHGLLLSELGGLHLRSGACSSGHEAALQPATNLLRSPKWEAEWAEPVPLATRGPAVGRAGSGRADAAADLGYECAGETREPRVA